MKPFSYPAIINHSLPKASTMNANILAGELVHINGDGQGSNVKGSTKISLPATRDAKFDSIQDLEVALVGCPLVVVTLITGIEFFSPLAVGADGKGVKLWVSGDLLIGYALAKPTANGQKIGILLAPIPAAANIY